MAIKTFTTGEVLTSSDTNTYLANSGLVYVTSATVGSAVASVAVTNAFNSTFDSYEIVYSGGTCSNTSDLRFSTPQSTGNNFFSQGLQQTSASSTLTGQGYGSIAFWVFGVSTATGFGVKATIHNPFLSTRFTTFSAAMASDFSIYTSGGVNNTNNSLTGFVLTPQTGTLTGGTITVYGYRKG